MRVLVKLITLVLALLAGAFTFLFAILDKYISLWTVFGRMGISMILFGCIGLIFARYLTNIPKEVNQSPDTAQSLEMSLSKDMEEELFDEQMEKVRQVTENENNNALRAIFDSDEEYSQTENIEPIFKPFTPEQFPNIAVPEKG